MGPAWRPATSDESDRIDSQAREDPKSGFMQSSWWAEFKRREGYAVTDLICEQVGAARLMDYPFGHERGFILCPEGPLLPWDETEICRAALRSLTEYVKASKDAIGLRIEPHLEPPPPSILRNWAKAPTDLTPADTLVLDLTRTDEELLTVMHPKCRYNLRIAARHGVAAHHAADMDLVHPFYSLLTETSQRDGFFLEPLGFFLNLCQTAFSAGAAEFVWAELDGQILAMMLLIHFGHRSTYLYGASSHLRRETMPNHAMHWTAIQRSHQRGSREYDLYGIDALGRRDHLYAGITRFKKQWGGTVRRRIGARDYIFYDRLADAVVQAYGTS